MVIKKKKQQMKRDKNVLFMKNIYVFDYRLLK